MELCRREAERKLREEIMKLAEAERKIAEEAMNRKQLPFNFASL